ncbi:hypothetical protein T459_20145 [Capsicum annuum]|uniref:Uncharacterized protein n=1 Tax=Capsicum annuum TaxID=4072 RepID=A0A2G2Z3R8_CAPAN|nr:hypothetical protein T459_20145 [Capsicum annuum]
MELFRATTITRKTILESEIVVVNDGSGSGSGAAIGANNAPLTVFEAISHYDYDYAGCIDFSPYFAISRECSTCKCQDCKAKPNGVTNVINALTASVKKMTSKRGVIPSKRISYSYTPLEIKVDVTTEATAEEHNIIVDNPSTAFKEEEKVKPVSSRERKNYPFEGFNISDEAPKKLTKLINNYSEWIVDGLLKYHANRKQDHEQYKVNKSSLGFDMFDFVVAHLGMMNWFYVISHPQTCWNNEV